MRKRKSKPIAPLWSDEPRSIPWADVALHGVARPEGYVMVHTPFGSFFSPPSSPFVDDVRRRALSGPPHNAHVIALRKFERAHADALRENRKRDELQRDELQRDELQPRERGWFKRALLSAERADTFPRAFEPLYINGRRYR